ncbi:MAG: hypothetical protein CVU48_04525 [Candidatus Cloacimonetes bacterium HGW-Cloacimonetes-1]|jgi:hypothetical protein|nr:MAG: hypothetical protein CVU48_04525 [Candidatus Cloacimonetes bacterium HGW-Cloacimonetes-1]
MKNTQITGAKMRAIGGKLIVTKQPDNGSFMRKKQQVLNQGDLYGIKTNYTKCSAAQGCMGYPPL